MFKVESGDPEEVLNILLSNECNFPFHDGSSPWDEDSPRRVFHLEGHCTNYTIVAEKISPFDEKKATCGYRVLSITVKGYAEG